MGADKNASDRGGGALERGHGAPFEPLAQLGDALGGVGAVAFAVDAAELVVGQAATGKEVVSRGADTGNQTLESRFERRVAYSSDRSVELPLMPSARAAPPSGPSRLPCRLRARERRLVLSSVNGR